MKKDELKKKMEDLSNKAKVKVLDATKWCKKNQDTIMLVGPVAFMAIAKIIKGVCKKEESPEVVNCLVYLNDDRVDLYVAEKTNEFEFRNGKVFQNGKEMKFK